MSAAPTTGLTHRSVALRQVYNVSRRARERTWLAKMSHLEQKDDSHSKYKPDILPYPNKKTLLLY